MAIPSAALATEITTDPKARGYAAPRGSGDDTAVAALLNSTYAGVATVWRTDLTNAEILAQFVAAELATRTAIQLQMMQIVLAPARIDASQANIRAIFANVWGGTATLAALTAVAQKTAPSRAEELWGYGTLVTPQDVARALGRG